MGYPSETSDRRTTPSSQEKPFQAAHLQPTFNRRADDGPKGTPGDHVESMEMLSVWLFEAAESLKLCLEKIARSHGKMVDAKVKSAQAAARNAERMDRIAGNG